MLFHRSITPRHVFLLLAVFLGLWLHSEFREDQAREEFERRVTEFMDHISAEEQGE